TVRNALAGGRRCGVATAAGVATGQAVWTVATSFGIAELIQASEPAFLALKLAGAAYLVALGIQSLWKALWTTRNQQSAVGLPSRLGPLHRRVAVRRARVRRRARVPRREPASGAGGSGADQGRGWMNPSRGLRQGVVSNLANPKMAAFFLSLLPQFAAPGQGAGGVLGLGLVFCLLTFAWLGLYSAVVDRARVVLGRTRVRRALEGVSGVVLVGFGARLALPQR
ncbi:MAG TPA: LysE family transporter, partial [Actinomycetes bacterium]|nr:LysE family transporter [Actinomycetes bacterium]